MRTQLIDHFETWTPWFAWYPVYIGHLRVWWERVERKKKMFGHDPIWEYRLSSVSDTGGKA